MHLFAAADQILWAAGFVGHIVLVAVLVTRGCVRVFPIFFSLLVYEALETILLFSVHRYGSAHAYFIVYWSFAPGDYAFQVALIYEMARIVLRPTGDWIRVARTAFLGWATMGAFVAAGLSLAITLPGLKGPGIWAARATIFTSLLTCMVFLAMSASASRLGLLWTSHVMALGQGLTCWALVALFGNVVQFGLGWQRGVVLLNHVHKLVYLGALAFWTVSFWRPASRRDPLSPAMQSYLIALHDSVVRDLEKTRESGGPP